MGWYGTYLVSCFLQRTQSCPRWAPSPLNWGPIKPRGQSCKNDWNPFRNLQRTIILCCQLSRTFSICLRKNHRYCRRLWTWCHPHSSNLWMLCPLTRYLTYRSCWSCLYRLALWDHLWTWNFIHIISSKRHRKRYQRKARLCCF